MPKIRKPDIYWDWDTFWDVFGTIVFCCIVGGIALFLVGMLIWVLWTAGLGWLIFAVGGFLAVAGLIAGVVTFFNS